MRRSGQGPIFSEDAEGATCAVARCGFCGNDLAWVAQLVERVLGKDEVTGSIPVPGSSLRGAALGASDSRPGAVWRRIS